MSDTENTEQEAGALSHLSVELGTLEFGDRVDFTIDGGFVARMRFTDKDDKDAFVQEAHNEFDVIAKDNPESRVEMFLVKTVLVKSSV